MVNNALIINKFYMYSSVIVKLKKIQKKQNKIIVERLDNGECVEIPYTGYEIILYRIYTVGEVSKILEKRADTLRKYEKRDLIPPAKKFGDLYKGYSNWRYYSEEDVYSLVEFFNLRLPGRPVKTNINKKIINLTQKVNMKVDSK